MKQETKTIEVKRFDTKLESDLLRALGKILSQQDGISEEKAVDLKDFAIMDSANVCMIVAKSEEAKRILSRFADNEKNEDGGYDTIPALYDHNCEGHTSKYSTEYLKKATDLFNTFDKHDKHNSMATRIWCAKDYPLIMENVHFKYILAPRVNNDGDDE